MTNKKEWDRFVRSKERFRVHGYFQTNKVELFNIWMDNEGSWDRTCLEVERIQSQSNEAKKGWYSVQGKTIRKDYEKEKAEAIITSRTNAGLYYDCPDFPNDVDDTCSCIVPLGRVKVPQKLTYSKVTRKIRSKQCNLVGLWHLDFLKF